MTFSLIWPSGLTDGISTVDAAELEQLDTDHAAAIDGTNGGTYAPSTALTIGGAGVFASGTGFFRTVAGGRIILGDNDYPTLGGAHSGASQVRARSFGFAAATEAHFISLGTTIPQTFALQGQNSVAGVADLELPVLNGGTLEQLDVTFAIVNGHGALPTSLPAFWILKQNAATGVITVIATHVLTAGSVVAYEALTSYSFTGLSEVIDRTTYCYFVRVRDESGTNAIVGNAYLVAKTTQAIADLRPQ